MAFTKDEKKVLAALVKEHLDEVSADEKRGDQPVKLLKSEERYQVFLKNLLKKLR
jgi:hypothetical protein